MTQHFRKGGRTVHIDSQTWEYKLGRGSAIIVSPKGKKSVVDYSTLTGRTWDVLERGQWKRAGDGMVTPFHVKSYIEKNMEKLT